MLLSELKDEAKLREVKVGEVVAEPEEQFDIDEWDILLPALDLMSDISKYLNLLIRRKTGTRITMAMQGEMAALCTEIESLLADSETFLDEGDGGEV